MVANLTLGNFTEGVTNIAVVPNLALGEVREGVTNIAVVATLAQGKLGRELQTLQWLQFLH